MTLRRTVSRIVSWWLARRVERAVPEIGQLRQAIAERARKHRNAAPLRRELRNRVIEKLAKEQGKRLTVSVKARGSR